MYWEMNSCPRCKSQIKQDQIVGRTIICSNCGWNDNIDWKKRDKREQLKGYFRKALLGVCLVLIAAFIFQHKTYKQQTFAYNLYQLQSITGLISSSSSAQLGDICFNVQKYECAQKAYNRAINSNTLNERPYVFTQLGKSLTFLGEYEAAVEAFEMVESLPEVIQDSYFEFGYSLQMSQQSERAIKAYYAGLSSKVVTEEHITNLITLLKSANKYTDAISVIGSYLFRYPSKSKEWNATVQSLFGEAEKTEPLYNSEQVALAGYNNKFHIPVDISGVSKTQMYMISEKSAYMTINGEVAKSNRVSISRKLGTIKLMTQLGRDIRAKRVLLSQVRMGPWLLRNVEAVICDNCAPVIGRSVLKKFKWSQSKLAETDLLALNIK